MNCIICHTKCQELFKNFFEAFLRSLQYLLVLNHNNMKRYPMQVFCQKKITFHKTHIKYLSFKLLWSSY